MVWRHCPRDLRSYPWGVPNLVETNHVGAQSVFFVLRSVGQAKCANEGKVVVFHFGQRAQT